MLHVPLNTFHRLDHDILKMYNGTNIFRKNETGKRKSCDLMYSEIKCRSKKEEKLMLQASIMELF